jgi:hypothetical protein
MRTLQLFTPMLVFLACFLHTPSHFAQSTSEHRVVSAKWENGKSVVTSGDLGGIFRQAENYVLHYPEGSFFNADNAELYKLDNGVLRRVKDAKGEPLRFFYPTLRMFGSNVYVLSRTGPGTGKEVKDAILWHVDELTATRVSVESTPLVCDRIEYCGGPGAHFVADTDKQALYRLAGSKATTVADLTKALPPGRKYSVHADAHTVLVNLHGDKDSGEPAGLHVFKADKLLPVKHADGAPLRAVAIGIHHVATNRFVWTMDEDKVGAVWRYADGVVRPIYMPGGGVADAVAILGLRSLADRMIFSRTSWADENDYQWSVGAGAPEPIWTEGGPHLGGWAVRWIGDGGNGKLVACVDESEDTSEGALWLYDGVRAKPLNDLEGKQLRASLPSLDLAGRWMILRQNINVELAYRYWLLDGNKNVGVVRREDGTSFEGPRISTHTAIGGIYLSERTNKQTRLYWLALK